jgi:histidinol-phosphate aminotransferase
VTGPIRPIPVVAAARAYAVPRAGAPCDLRLDANEGEAPPEAWLEALRALSPEALRRYPGPAQLEARLATPWGLDPAQVVLTAGGDDALCRACRAMLAPGRSAIVPVPGFEIVLREVRLTGADLIEVPWGPGPLPTDAIVAAVREDTTLIVVTHPNNPSGGWAIAEDLRRLRAAAPQALLLVDLAYVEFADEDLTAVALALPGTLVVRTLSKAWGLAGLRLGWAAGPAEVVGWLRAVGLPYPVAGPSLAVAGAALDAGTDAVQDRVSRVREERAAIGAALEALGGRVWPSQASFVLVEVPDPLWLRDALAGLGIAVRAFPGKPGLERAVRIGCPGDARGLERLSWGLRAALAPAGVDSEPGAPFSRLPGLPLGAPGWRIVTSAAGAAEARAQGLVPLGLAPEAQADALIAAGCARVYPDLDALEAQWP